MKNIEWDKGGANNHVRQSRKQVKFETGFIKYHLNR